MKVAGEDAMKAIADVINERTPATESVNALVNAVGNVNDTLIGILNKIGNNNVQITSGSTNDYDAEGIHKNTLYINTDDGNLYINGKEITIDVSEEDIQNILNAIKSDIPTKTSELINDSGFITEADVPASSGSGNVHIIKTNTPLNLNNINEYTFWPKELGDLLKAHTLEPIYLVFNQEYNGSVDMSFVVPITVYYSGPNVGPYIAFMTNWNPNDGSIGLVRACFKNAYLNGDFYSGVTVSTKVLDSSGLY